MPSFGDVLVVDYPAAVTSEATVIVVGYGSLMSDYGRACHGGLRPRAVRRVALVNARRGFGKASLHGDRLAMVLEPVDWKRPLAATPLNDGEDAAPPHAVAMELDMCDLSAVARREGYSEHALATLCDDAALRDSGVAAHLQQLLDATDGDLAAYRTALYCRVGYTSPHYIPHPIDVGGEPGIIFLAAGPEGSGSPDVVPVRVDTQCCELMTASEVWRHKPNRTQLDYIAMCLLGAAMGVRVDDLLVGLSDEVRASLDDLFTDRPAEQEVLRRLLG